MKRIKDFFSNDDRVAVISVPFFKCLGFGVLIFEAIMWTMAYELLLFEIIPDLFQRNLLIDLVATTCGCGLLMGTVRSLYGAFKVKNYADPVEANKAFNKKEDSVDDITKSKRYCKKCKLYKGNTYSHCSICNKCVYEMDHHCFFLANCVGGNNYKFFLSYVIYAAMNSILHFIFYLPYIPHLISFRLSVFRKVGIIKLSICFCMALMAAFFTVFLLGSHIYYMINNTSYLKNRFGKNKTDYGWKRFLFWYFRCGKGDDEMSESYRKGYARIFGSKSPFKALWPDF